MSVVFHKLNVHALGACAGSTKPGYALRYTAKGTVGAAAAQGGHLERQRTHGTVHVNPAKVAVLLDANESKGADAIEKPGNITIPGIGKQKSNPNPAFSQTW